MDASEIRDRIGRLIIDDAFRICKGLYTHYEKIDQYAAIPVIACLCKLTNVILKLKSSSEFSSKDFADDFVYDGLKAVFPTMENIYDSDQAAENPILLLPPYEYPLASQFSDPLIRISFTCDKLLDQVREICIYKPDNYNYNSLYLEFAEFSNRLFQIVKNTYDNSHKSSTNYRTSPPVPAKKSSGNGFLKFLLGVAIIIIIYLFYSKGVH